MSLLDDARMLAEDGLEHDHPCGGCGAALYLSKPHAEDCPLVAALPKIVAAVEAAERVVRSGEQTRAKGSTVAYVTDWVSWQALVAALEMKA